MLKQSELFVFMSLFFLVLMFIVEGASREQLERVRRENPPIIILSEENDDYRFSLGSATPTEAFKNALLSQIIPLLDSVARGCSCDGIEVIGHTDGVPVRPRASDLDDKAVQYFRELRADSLSAGSNVDLGMMRALTVLDLIHGSQRLGFLSGVRFFLPYSAGQMIQRDRTMADATDRKEDLARRRIEIRLLKIASRQVQ